MGGQYNVIGRFQVMAILQCARAAKLGMSLKSAQAFGYNRAIWYSVAKSGLFKTLVESSASSSSNLETMYVGDEKTYVSSSSQPPDNIVFQLGDQEHSFTQYRKAIESRFGQAYADAWEEAKKIVDRYDDKVLHSKFEFYQKVYAPRRDKLAAQWSNMVRDNSLESFMKRQQLPTANPNKRAPTQKTVKKSADHSSATGGKAKASKAKASKAKASTINL